MNNLILTVLKALSIAFLISNTHAKVKIVPLESELGQWVTTSNTNQSQMMDKMLEKYPKDQRKMMKKMMSKMMPKKGGLDTMKQEQCITKDSYKDMESKLKKSLGGQNANKCKLTVTKSTKKYFSAVIDCGEIKSNIETKVINSKKNVSKAVTNIPIMGKQEITTTSVWVSSKCK